MCHRSFSRLDALNRHQRTEGGSACHYRQNRRRVEQRHETTDSTPTSTTPTTSKPHQSPPSLQPPPPQQPSPGKNATFSSSSSQPSRHTAQSRPNIPQLDLRHRFSSPYHPDDHSPQQQQQPVVFRSSPVSASPSAIGSPHETHRRIVLPPPTSTASTPTNSTPTTTTATPTTNTNTTTNHPPPPHHHHHPTATTPTATTPNSTTTSLSISSISHRATPYPPSFQPHESYSRRSSGASDYDPASPGSFASPESFTALRYAYAQLTDQYRAMQHSWNTKYDAKVDEVESLKRQLHDLQVEVC